jgi:cyclopropane fatty-acyl-phospholipid synthase-like methyltransferase
MFLAMQGHEVISVESSAQTVREGQQIARALGSTVMTHRFVRADMRELDLATEFGPQDAILAIRSLQQVSMAEAETAVATMQAATTPGGLNAVQAYIARPDQKPSLPHLALFEPGQLEATYQQAGWETAHRESQLHELDYSMGLPQCRSTTQLITVKPTA